MVTEAFQGAAAARAAVLGLPEHPRVIVEHPLASRTPSEVEKVAVAAVARIAAGLSRETAPRADRSARAASSSTTSARAQRRDIAGDFVVANGVLEELGWTDGLPVIPPTEALVSAMLSGATRAPEEVLGRMEPLQGTVTVEKVAANAVMAGCRPEYFPVVLASVRAVLQPAFNVGSTACTTGGSAPLIIVNGPIAQRLGISGGTACFGGNIKANATIGRALRLVMRNIGGAKPDGMEKSTQAWPGKIACCFAENEARSPWEPFHVERGYAADTSIVTVVATRGIYSVTEGVQTSGQGVLETLVASMRYVGSPIYHQMHNGIPLIVALCPEHAEEIARAGFDRRAVREFIYAHARMPVRVLRDRGYYAPDAWKGLVDESDPDAMVPIVKSPDRIILVVAGGDGRHSSWMPAWGVCQGATEIIRDVG
ncbi:MAG TPA: hypothetical protein VK548_00170 [Candidatus Acidoferrum sp.]|nr:hypothetical protein [Candidatus Acidoferrum sp.]